MKRVLVVLLLGCAPQNQGQPATQVTLPPPPVASVTPLAPAAPPPAVEADVVLAPAPSGQWSGSEGNAPKSITAIWGLRPVVFAAARGDVLVSRDRGLHWTVAKDGFDADAVWGPALDDVYVGGDGVLHSTDRGKTFTTLAFPQGHVSSIWGSSAEDVYAVTIDGRAARTTDHGTTWTELNVPHDMLHAVTGTGPHDVWIAGSRHVRDPSSSIGYHTEAVLLRSTDQGNTWKSAAVAKPNMTSNEEIRRSCFTASGMLVASYSYSVYGTADQGKSWKRLVDVGTEVIGLTCSSHEIIVGARNRAFQRSTDEGVTWTSNDLDPLFKTPSYITLQTAFVADTGEEYVGGEAYNRSGAGTLLRRAP